MCIRDRAEDGCPDWNGLSGLVLDTGCVSDFHHVVHHVGQHDFGHWSVGISGLFHPGTADQLPVAGAHKIRDFEPGHGLHDGLFNGSELAIIDLYRGVDHAGPGIWKPDRGGCGLYLAARDRCNRIKEKSAVAGA